MNRKKTKLIIIFTTLFVILIYGLYLLLDESDNPSLLYPPIIVLGLLGLYLNSQSWKKN